MSCLAHMHCICIQELEQRNLQGVSVDGCVLWSLREDEDSEYVSLCAELGLSGAEVVPSP
jgi:hypothetical protein